MSWMLLTNSRWVDNIVPVFGIFHSMTSKTTPSVFQEPTSTIYVIIMLISISPLPLLEFRLVFNLRLCQWNIWSFGGVLRETWLPSHCNCCFAISRTSKALESILQGRLLSNALLLSLLLCMCFKRQFVQTKNRFWWIARDTRHIVVYFSIFIARVDGMRSNEDWQCCRSLYFA